MIITNEIIFNELRAQREILEQLIKRDIETSTEEWSMSKTAKCLHVSTDKLIEYIKENRLKARRIPSGKTKFGFTFKFRVADIYAFQKQEATVNVSPDTNLEKDTDLVVWFKSLRSQFHSSYKGSTPMRKKKSKSTVQDRVSL